MRNYIIFNKIQNSIDLNHLKKIKNAQSLILLFAICFFHFFFLCSTLHQLCDVLLCCAPSILSTVFFPGVSLSPELWGTGDTPRVNTHVDQNTNVLTAPQHRSERSNINTSGENLRSLWLSCQGCKVLRCLGSSRGESFFGQTDFCLWVPARSTKFPLEWVADTRSLCPKR